MLSSEFQLSLANKVFKARRKHYHIRMEQDCTKRHSSFMYKDSIYICIGSNLIEASLKGSSAFVENVAICYERNPSKKLFFNIC